MNDKVKIEIIDNFIDNGHLMIQIDAGIIDPNDIEDLFNDIRMIIELRKKRMLK